MVTTMVHTSSFRCGICGLFNPLKPKLIKNIFKNSVRTAKKTQHFTITKINWLTLFKEIIAVYSENRTKPINKTVGEKQNYWLLKQVVHILTSVLIDKRGCQKLRFYSLGW
jgi:hypothetical protein